MAFPLIQLPTSQTFCRRLTTYWADAAALLANCLTAILIIGSGRRGLATASGWDRPCTLRGGKRGALIDRGLPESACTTHSCASLTPLLIDRPAPGCIPFAFLLHPLANQDQLPLSHPSRPSICYYSQPLESSPRTNISYVDQARSGEPNPRSPPHVTEFPFASLYSRKE